jgi:hypothetical protein
MDLHINLWGVLLAGVSSMVIGAVYYAPPLLGKVWMKLAKIDGKRFQKEMPRVMLPVFLAALVTSYFVAYFSFMYHSFFGNSWLASSVVTALLLWVGVSATTLYIHNSLEQRPANLTVISLGNRLLSLLAMGLIVGWLHP